MNDLAEKHYRLIEGFCKRYKIDYEEHYGTLAIALVKASHNYKAENNCKFSTFAYSVMRNAVLNEIRNNNRDALFHCESLDNKYDNTDTFIELISMPTPERTYLKIPHDITEREKQVLKYYLQGYSLREISVKLNLSANRVSNIYSEMIDKFKKVNGVYGKPNIQK